MAKKYFKETIEIKDKKTWALIASLFFVSLVPGFYHHLSAENVLIPILAALTVLLTIGLLIYLIISIRLKTRVTSKGIDFKLSPFQHSRKRIFWNDIISYRIVESPPLSIPLNWRFSYWVEKRFTLTGRNGVSITTADGNTYFIGTTNPERLRTAIEKAVSRSSRMQ